MNTLENIDSEEIAVSQKFKSNKALTYEEPKLEKGKIDYKSTPFPESIINNGSRLAFEPKTAAVNKKKQPIIKNSTEVSTVVHGGFVHNSGINKGQNLGAGAFLVVKNKSNPEENYLLVAKRATKMGNYMAVHGGSRVNNEQLDSAQLTVSKELLEETMGAVSMSNDQVENFSATYGVHVHNRQGRSIEAKLEDGKIEPNNQIKYDNSEYSYEYQTTVVEIEIDNPLAWGEIQKMDELASIAQDTLKAFEYTAEPSKEKTLEAKAPLKGYLAVKKLEKEGLSESASKELSKRLDFTKIDLLIKEVISKTPDGKEEGFKKLMDAVKKGKAVNAKDFLEGSKSLLNHTENQSYDLVDLKAFQQAAKATVEGGKVGAKLAISREVMTVHPREAFVFERLRFESVKKLTTKNFALESKEIAKRIPKLKNNSPKNEINERANRKLMRARSVR